MHVRYEVPQDSSCDSKSPDPIGLLPEDLHVEILPHLRCTLLPPAPTVQFYLLHIVRVGGRREHGAESQRQKDLDEHEGAKDLECVIHPNGFANNLQEDRKAHGEEAAAGSHQAICQTQPPFEVVTEDNQRGLEGKGAAASKEDPVREIADFKRPVGETRDLLHFSIL